MGPGARHSALDDSWGGWNWKKVLGLGKFDSHPHGSIRYRCIDWFVGSLLATNLIKASEMASRQRKAADDFTTTFPDETVKEWRKMVKDWQEDSSLPNPYASEERGMFFQCYLVAAPYHYIDSIKAF